MGFGMLVENAKLTFLVNVVSAFILVKNSVKS